MTHGFYNPWMKAELFTSLFTKANLSFACIVNLYLKKARLPEKSGICTTIIGTTVMCYWNHSKLMKAVVNSLLEKVEVVLLGIIANSWFKEQNPDLENGKSKSLPWNHSKLMKEMSLICLRPGDVEKWKVHWSINFHHTFSCQRSNG